MPRSTGIPAALMRRSSSAANPSSAGPVSQNVASSAAGQGEPRVDVLARDRPGRLQHQRAAVGHPQRRTDLRPPPRDRSLVEAVVDGGGDDPPPLRERTAGRLVDGHVPPLRVVWRPRREPGVLLALPGQVVVAQHGGATGQVLPPRPPRPQGSSAASRRCRPPRGRRRRARRRAGPATAGRSASMASPSTSRSARPAPATVVTCIPSRRRAVAHCAAVTETPSAVPSR